MPPLLLSFFMLAAYDGTAKHFIIIMTKLLSNYEDLNFFQNYEEDVLSDFVEIAHELLTNNKFKHKSYSNAACKLNTDNNHIEKLIETIAGLLLESVKLKITQSVFVSSLQPILLEQTKVLKIWDKIDLTRDLIIQILSKTDIKSVKFSSLNWRLEHTLASKSLGSCKDTKILMELTLNNSKGNKKVYFNADIPNIFHLAEVLEGALNETKASHIRKVINNK